MNEATNDLETERVLSEKILGLIFNYARDHSMSEDSVLSSTAFACSYLLMHCGADFFPFATRIQNAMHILRNKTFGVEARQKAIPFSCRCPAPSRFLLSSLHGRCRWQLRKVTPWD